MNPEDGKAEKASGSEQANEGFNQEVSRPLSQMHLMLRAALLACDSCPTAPPRLCAHGCATHSPPPRRNVQMRKQVWGTKQFQQYIGKDVTSLLSLPVWIMEPFTILQKAAEIMEYTELLDKADQCDDPYER